MLKTINVNQLSTTLTEHFDLFICFNSYESRATSIPANIDHEKFKHFIIFSNQTLREEASRNLELLKSILPQEKCVIAKLPLDNPVESADHIRCVLRGVEGFSSSSRIFIDITTFTHESLLILLAILKDYVPNATVCCGYINAREYSYDCEKQKDKWLSRGIGEIRSVLGYSGIIKPSQKTLLMVIVGYEYERAISIIDAIEPDFLSLGYGIASDSTTEKNQGANEHYAQLVKQMATYYEDVYDFTLPCNDPFAASQAILKQIEAVGTNKNIILVPMNNKISTIGAALVCLELPHVQLCYAPALVYNYSAYSTPGEKCYLFDMPSAPQK